MSVLKLAMKVVEKDNKKEPIMKPGHCMEAVSFCFFCTRLACAWHQDSEANGKCGRADMRL